MLLDAGFVRRAVWRNAVNEHAFAAFGESEAIDETDKKLDALADVARGIARDKKLPLNDLRKAFIDYWKKNNPDNKARGFLTYDGNHWTEAGHQYVAEQMLKKFK